MPAGQVASVAPAGEVGIEAAHKAMLAERGLQFDFAAFKPADPPGWLEPLAKFLEAVAPALRWMFWAFLAVGAAMILYFLVRELMRIRLRRRAPHAKPAAAEWRPEPARALLEDADRLAAEGRFDEAVRLLLHRSIDDFSGRRPGAVRTAHTSRDIASLAAMPARARAAFEAIAQAVESSFFAARPARSDDFARCRQAYERFAFPEAWR